MKYGLIFGCNYQGRNKLYGCINDANHMEVFLTNHQFSCHKYIDDLSSRFQPTRELIIETLTTAVKTLTASDILFIFYSGHGSQTCDLNGDEVDGQDECLVPCDYKTSGMITDDVLREILNQAPEGSRIFALFDACHSATALDLTFNFTQKMRRVKSIREIPTTAADIWLLSGCLDEETSTDTNYNGIAGGAITFAFLETVAKATSMFDLLKRVRKFIRDSKLSEQTPQLSSGRNSNDTDLFFM